MLQSLKTFVENKLATLTRPTPRSIAENVDYFKLESEETIYKRIEELDKEWDKERVAALNGSFFIIAGVLLGATVNKKWLVLPAAVSACLAWQALKGQAVTVPGCNNLRSRQEIAQEQYALEAILKNGELKKHDY